jgi:hypothetical protein
VWFDAGVRRWGATLECDARVRRWSAGGAGAGAGCDTGVRRWGVILGCDTEVRRWIATRGGLRRECDAVVLFPSCVTLLEIGGRGGILNNPPPHEVV